MIILLSISKELDTSVFIQEPLGEMLVSEEQYHQPVAPLTDLLIRHGEAISFEVVAMEPDVVEQDGVILVSSKFPRNGPETYNGTGLPTRMQRIALYLAAKERQAIADGERVEPPTRTNSLTYREVKFSLYWLDQQLKLFDVIPTEPQTPEKERTYVSER
jgi:hypothetical protein